MYSELLKFWQDVKAMNTEKFANRPIPQGVCKVSDVAYIDDGDAAHTLDVYYPQGEDRLITIFNIHGGGWTGGSKEIEYAFHGARLAAEGFTVVNINYRLSPEHIFPAQLEDIIAALEWVRAHDGEYRIDSSRIVLEGDSAGAHLAALTACIATNPDYAKALSLECPIEIRALGLCCGAYDFDGLISGEFMGVSNEITVQSFMCGYNGGSYSDNPLYAWAHPLRGVTADFPPSFLMGVESDPLHPLTIAMCEKLSSLGVTHQLLFFKKELELWHCFHLDNDRPVQSDQVLHWKSQWYRICCAAE